MGLLQSDVAAYIGTSVDSYRKKERGEIQFSALESVMVADFLLMTQDEANEILYENRMPKAWLA